MSDFAIATFKMIDDVCDRAITRVPAGERFVFHTIASVAAYFHERGLAEEADRIVCLLENDLLPSRLMPRKGTKEYRAFLALVANSKRETA